MKKLFLILLLISIISSVIALSIESENAKSLLDSASEQINQMTDRGIPTKRVMEIYTDTYQLYSAQNAFEEKGGRGNYKLIDEYTKEILSIKDASIEASDELQIFKETFAEENKTTDFSEMKEEYNQIIASFEEERFEETIKLIEDGYAKMSEIQSNQAAAKVFYSSVSKTLKDFFIDNWKRMLIIISLSSIVFLIFRKSINKIKLRLKFNQLLKRKEVVKILIKKLQNDYFKIKNISESGYHVKLKKFKEIIRDIDREIMNIKEEIVKSRKRTK